MAASWRADSEHEGDRSDDRGYFLGIDVGTTEVHAATARETLDGDLLCVDAPLGDEGGGAPALAFVTPDGSLQYGQRARESGILEPERLIREYRCSVGDDLPLFVGGHRVRPDEVLAGAIASVVETVTASEGAAPLGLALTHPTSWGPHRRDVVRSALAARGIPRIEMVPEPEAAARHHDAARGFEPGQALLMYDLGAAALDVTLLRKGAEGDWVVVGEPLTMSDVGGSCFDDAVLAHVLDVAPPEDHGAEPDEIRRGLAQLRQECAAAREELSFDPEVVIPLAALGRQTTVRLTRSEFEGMIDQQIERTCDALEDLLEDSGTSMDEVDAILLVGGASRTPRVAQHLSEQFDRPMVLDPHARSVAALGAARVGCATGQCLQHTGRRNWTTSRRVARRTCSRAPGPAGRARPKSTQLSPAAAAAFRAITDAGAAASGPTFARWVPWSRSRRS